MHGHGTMIDLTRFCADENELCTYLQKPLRTAQGMVYCNGHILVCAPYLDDGEEYATTPAIMQDALARFARESSAAGESVDMQSLVLPEARVCPDCNGAGYLYVLPCESCDGEGTFKHYGHEYECRECEGCGYASLSQLTDHSKNKSAKRQKCTECDSYGDQSQSVPLGNAFFARHYLAMIADLPGCKLWPNGTTNGSAFTFDGGYGWLMPRSF